MSIRMKLVSLVTAFILVLGLVITGVLAASSQTITMNGSVNFNVSDKSLWVKEVRMQEAGSDPVVISNFTPGYINGDFNFNVGDFENNRGSFVIYFDIINTTTNIYSATVDYSGLSSITGLEVNITSTIPANTEAITAITADTPITTTLELTVSNPNLADIDLSLIIINIVEQLYQRVDADGTPNENGGYILFGYYPQTIKAANVNITSTTDERGYYLGSDGEYYVQVDADPHGSDYTFSNGTSVNSGTIYYFKVEPLLWRILDDNYGDGTALIVSNNIIDAKPFQSSYTTDSSSSSSNVTYYYVVGEDGTILTDETATAGLGVNANYQVYANNYKHSEIRQWLNSTFYDMAFTSSEKTAIVTTEVDNSATGAPLMYTCENTFDNIFLLSTSEMGNNDYGYSFSYPDPLKAIVTSDYSRAKGANTYTNGNYIGTGDAILRNETNNVPYVIGGWTSYAYNGTVYYSFNVYNTYGGVVPALQIQL